MSVQTLVPVLPESAPFSPEQRAYLNGFLAGLFSRAAVAPPTASAPPQTTLETLTILFGSQTGTAERVAKRIAKEAGKHGFAAAIYDLAKYPAAQLASERNVLVVTSTYGDGEPPDNAKAFWNFLSAATAPRLAQTRFSVCALGDTNYPKFCGFGKQLDARLEALGAQRVHPRADCDVEYEEPFAKWLAGTLPSLTSRPVSGGAVIPAPETKAEEPTGPSRENPVSVGMIANRKLNGPGSGKDVRHFEFTLEGTGLAYAAGDAFGVYPHNCPLAVDDILRALGCDGEEVVPGRSSQSISLRHALLRHYEIGKVPTPVLRAFAERSGDEMLHRLLAPEGQSELGKFLWGREVIDLLLAYPQVKFKPAEFVALLRKLQPRLYSISSSPKAHPGQVHLTVNVVRYESHGRGRKGVCSTFLAERTDTEVTVPAFIHANPAFRPPTNADAPLIMIGPGTGIAPFRAFLHERKATGAKGRNWLFFGDQRAATDFLYREELTAMANDGTLARLDTAFSRDQEEKIYVQHRMLENARELFGWLENGGHFYVCGDAARMARDVDAALHQVVERAGGRTPAQAAEYVEKLRAEKRYQRDVY